MAAHILLIDDDRDFLEALTAVLEIDGYRVTCAYDGETGYRAAVREKPDVIVLDVMMNTMTEGLHVARQLHNDETTRHIPVLMLSSVRKVLGLTEELAPDDINLPVHRFLEKPIETDKLLSEIGELLEGRGGA